MSLIEVLALAALVGLVLLLLTGRCIYAQIEADRQAEIARTRHAQRQYEARINRMAASAIHQMIEAAHRNRIDPPPQ